MVQKTMLAERIDAAGANAGLDAACKRVVANKLILAWIMKHTMREYRDYDVGIIAERFIEGDPIVSGAAVHQDEMYIRGETAWDNTITEGTVVYDIRFRAIVPHGRGHASLIINVEAQKDFYPGYPLIKWGIYYCCRMISGQYGTEFTDSHYENIHKVYSIWICINPPKRRRYSIAEYSITENCKAGNVQEQAENYDLLSAIMICLGEASEEAESQKVIDLLNILLASEMDVKEKKKHLEQDFGIKMTKQLEEETGKMCNYSEYIEERGVEKGIERGIEKGIAALINTCRTLGATWDMTLKQLREQFEISEDKAEEKMQQYWKK